ncbi:MAG: TIM barrel protein [Deltaproteobacteria bacterium]|nr:TIM barrel protein [Deltaproteobacteria bacterium]
MKNKMIPKIGVTTQVIHESRWYKYLASLGVTTVEVNRRNSKLYFDYFFLKKIKAYTRGYDLSMHSGTRGVFHTNPSFTNADLAILTAELDICSLLGMRQFIFHLNSKGLTKENKNRLRDLFACAADHDIMMMYESDSYFTAGDAYDVLESFPDLKYVFDMGHLNNSSGKGLLGCEMEAFIRNVRDRVEYIHASNNYGTRDEHNSLDKGTLEWRGVLDMLDLTKVIKIIIEVRDSEMACSSQKELEQYLSDRYNAGSVQRLKVSAF